MKTTLRGSSLHKIPNPHAPGVKVDFLSENDLVLGDSGRMIGESATKDIVCVFGRKAVRNVCDACINTNRGEIQIAVRRGVPYLPLTLGGVSQDAVSDWAAFAQQTILGVVGVSGIRSFSYNIVSEGRGRGISYMAVIDTEFDGDGDGADEDVVVSGIAHSVTAIDAHR